MFSSLFAGLVLVAVGAGFQPAMPAPEKPVGPVPTSLELLSPSRFGEVRVSPSGRYVALVRRQGVRDVLVVIDRVAKAQNLAFDKTDMASIDIREVIWKGDDRLVVFWSGFSVKTTTSGGVRTKTVDGEALGVIDSFDRGASAVARTGGPLTDLGEGTLGARLPKDVGHILILQRERKGRPRTGQTRGWRDIYGVPNLYSVDVNTGKRALIEKGADGTMSWVADSTGKPTVRYDIYGRKGGLQVMGLDPEGKWVPTFAIRPKDVEAMEDIALLAPTGDPGKFYVAVKPEGESGVRTRELRIYDFTTRTMGEKIWSHPTYDFTSILLRDDGRRLAAICYWADTHACDYLDPAEKREMKALGTFFTADRSVQVEDQSEDASVQVLTVTGPEEPRSYYIYDRKTQRADLLGSGHPALRPDRLAIASTHGWKASDGLELTGYLTSPARPPTAKPPLIVMPHGGPEARDFHSFDAWAQAFATRGYVVFQPNFRGSGGFGVDFAEKGYGQWGLRMQDDVIDGVKDLIAKGLVDPDRICIVGASYGGYVALQAGAKNPELFKCVVSRAGVSDLTAMMKWEKTWFDDDGPRYQYWVKSIGDPAKDSDRLKATSPITYAKSYGPPVLLLHGDWDWTVPLEQSEIMEKALKGAGKSVELVEYKNEEHGGWSTRNDVDALDRMIAFVEKAIGTPKP